MQRSQQDKLTEVLLGEAIMTLLEENAPLNGARLAECLRKMMATETHPDRRNALNFALAEVNAHFSSARRSEKAERRSFSVFPVTGFKKH